MTRLPRPVALALAGLALTATLAACGTAAPATPPADPTVAPAANVAATVEASVKATMAAAPTATPAPLPTVAPTSVPTKPVAAAKETLTAEKVLAAFTVAGLEADSPRPMAREDYKLAPYSRDVAGVRFLVPSLGPDNGGRVFVGPDADLKRLETYFTEVGKASAAFYSHVFRHGNALVQINGDLKDDQAAKYEAALKGL